MRPQDGQHFLNGFSSAANSDSAVSQAEFNALFAAVGNQSGNVHKAVPVMTVGAQFTASLLRVYGNISSFPAYRLFRVTRFEKAA